ncbi:hypothetical protein [Sorangium sp. So ce1000]|uniref:hypothetical protein n=1 Tax=Sorangium sp. So ce1000 TaxID=3133325 RepID=UPI003F61F132
MTRRTAHTAGRALGLAVALSSCGLALGIEPLASEGGACDSAAACDDDNPCTRDVCLPQGVCDHEGAPDGPLPSEQQTPGDCKVRTCHSGDWVELPDDLDTADDGEDCTLDSCSSGAVVFTVEADGAPCAAGGSEGVCSGGRCTPAAPGGSP